MLLTFIFLDLIQHSISFVISLKDKILGYINTMTLSAFKTFLTPPPAVSKTISLNESLPLRWTTF